MAMMAGLASAGMSLAGGLGGLMGGGGDSAKGVQLPQMFQMPGMGGAANNAFGGTQTLGNFNLYDPNTASGLAYNMVNNPNSGSYNAGANTAMGLGQNAALNNYTIGGGLSALGGNAFGMANQLWNNAADPQNSLYARTSQQLQDQMRASQSARGVAMTPYGAGLENQGMSNFNIDWQNNLLSRMLSGAQGVGQLGGLGSSLIGQGQGLQSGAAGQYLSSSAMPWTTFNATNNAGFGALAQLQQYGQGGAMLPQQQIEDYLKYISAGNSAGSVANQTGQLGLQQQQQGFNQNQIYGSQIGAGLQGLGRAYSGVGTPGSGGSSFLPSASFLQNGMSWG